MRGLFMPVIMRDSCEEWGDAPSTARELTGASKRNPNSGRWNASKDSIDRQVFVNLGPVNSEAGTGGLPSIALFGRRIEEARIPRERHAHASAVRQINDQRLVRDMDVDDLFASSTFQSIHSTP